ncbi:MAG: carbohydrate ABC transporter permease [Bifidobacteriaceae bacterium]|jgi:multiple sugar transport system permease protein|nr:carbohydrate ABC transporter permease [Bifidobacteriaceae bacterium]
MAQSLRGTTGKGPRVWGLVAFKLLLVAGFVVATVFPLLWMAVCGLKEKNEVTRTPFKFFPEVFKWENYKQILDDPAFIRSIGITFTVAILFALGSLVVNSMAAYVFARLEFIFKRVAWVVVIGTMFIPWMTILLTSFLVVSELHLVNKIWVLILPAMASAGQIFFIRQFYLGIPSSLEEAALIDGASRFQVFLRIFVPMSKGIFVVSGMSVFLAGWNTYVWAVITMSDPKMYVIQQYLTQFRGERTTELGLLMAAATLSVIPVLILYFIFQRQIVQGARLSGFK